MLGAYELLYRFSSTSDRFFLWAGLLGATLFGSSMPAFCFVFGEMMEKMGEQTAGGGFEALKTQAMWMTIVAVFV